MYIVSMSNISRNVLQALHSAINPVYVIMPASIAASFAFMLPVATPSNAVVFSLGYIKITDMVKYYYNHSAFSSKL